MQLPPDPSSPWFAVFFAAMWFGVTGLLSVLSGWHGMAERWREAQEHAGERFRFRSASIGMRFFPVGYGNCLNFTVSERGLGISLLFVFRFLSPPLFIPWTEVTEVKEGKFLFFRYVVVQPKDHWSRIKVYGAVAEKVLASSRGRLRGAA